ncbi:uncharacterized protein LOC116297190 isoform X2 [Actinia tenebrosa]|uniref:Uncharacterized protein LOC116297190 isoform X2 n=1 Tax=Actinia tenebrosa TaxID=6105 RepID=A0A6P8HXY3_ACTTE|nr:uncharacterized protein LOC116297190 isoform X2 [Actinia tenebrosa]
MASSRERCAFFKDRVLRALYQDDEESSDEEIEKQTLENLNKPIRAAKRKDLEHPVQDIKTEESEWPVPLPKLKKVYTVTVKPEDLQQTVNSKTQGRVTTTSTATPSRSGEVSHQQTEGLDSSTKTEEKLNKNKKRKLKKKRRQKEKEQIKSQEFTYRL